MSKTIDYFFVPQSPWAYFGHARFVRMAAEASAPGADTAPAPAGTGPLDAALTELETRMVRDTLAAAGGNQSEAARRLGISRVGLVKKLTRLGLR